MRIQICWQNLPLAHRITFPSHFDFCRGISRIMLCANSFNRSFWTRKCQMGYPQCYNLFFYFIQGRSLCLLCVRGTMSFITVPSGKAPLIIKGILCPCNYSQLLEQMLPYQSKMFLEGRQEYVDIPSFHLQGCSVALRTACTWRHEAA